MIKFTLGVYARYRKSVKNELCCVVLDPNTFDMKPALFGTVKRWLDDLNIDYSLNWRDSPQLLYAEISFNNPNQAMLFKLTWL